MAFKEKEDLCKFCGIINYKNEFLIELEDPETKQRYLACEDCIEEKNIKTESEDDGKLEW